MKILFLFLLTILACGKENQDNQLTSSPKPESESEEQTATSLQYGTYRAILRPLNNQLSGFLPTGIAEVLVTKDKIKITTLLDDDARVIHIQNIYTGTKCPDEKNDTNNDGVIDVIEAGEIAGDVFIPLDGDLSSAEAGMGLYPRGRGFTYVEETLLNKIQTDLSERKKSPLVLENKVVMIHGVSALTPFPSSVQTNQGIPIHQSVPVTCGVLSFSAPL